MKKDIEPELRLLSEIKPSEVDEFIDHFKIKGCVTIKSLEKRIAKYPDCVIYHSVDGWRKPNPNNLDQIGLNVSRSGVIYSVNDNVLKLFYFKDKYVLEPKLKHWVSLSKGTFGYINGMNMYFDFFKSKGFGGVDRGLNFTKNMLVKFKNNLIKLP